MRRPQTIPLTSIVTLAFALVAMQGIAAAQVEDDLRECDRYYEEAEWKKAASACDSAIKKYPSQVPAEAYGKRASIFIITKDLQAGLKWVQTVAKKQYPDAPEILEYEALFLWGLNKKGDAIVVAELAVKGKEGAFLAQNMIGEYNASRDSARTVKAYEAYLQYRPADQEKNDVMPRIRLGFAYLDLGNITQRDGTEKDAKAKFTKAVEQFELLKRKFAKANGAAVNADNGLCAAYTALKKADQAITICEQIIREPKRIDARGSVWYNLAKAYIEKKQYAKARTAATEFIKLKGKEAKGHILVGDSYFYAGDYQRALENYLRAEQLLKAADQGRGASLAIQMGIAYRKLPTPDLGKAIEKLEAGLQTAPKSTEVAIELGTAYLNNKDDGKALATTDRRLKAGDFGDNSDDQVKKLHVVAAKALFNLGKFKESKDHFGDALKLRPNDVEVKRGLVSVITVQAYMAFKKDDIKASSTLLAEAAGLDPSTPSISVNRAVIAIKQGDCAGAQKQLEKIKGSKGYDLTYQRLIARTYLCIEKPDKKKAAEHYALADKEVKKVQANLVQAEIYTEWAPLLMAEPNANLDDVVSKLQDAVQFSSGEKDINKAAKRNLVVALFRRGWRSLKDGKSSEAASDFERASREPLLLKGSEPLAFEFSYALALLDKGDANEAAKLFKALATKGNQSSYLKAPYNKVGTTFFAAYANYRSGSAKEKQQAAKDFASLESGASGSFGAKIKDLLASSWEYVAYDHWKNGKNGPAEKALASAAKYAENDIKKRVTHNKAALSMGSKQLSVFEGLGGTPAEAYVNLGILLDQAGKPKEAYEAWVKALAKGANAKDLKKWIDAKKRIYGFN